MARETTRDRRERVAAMQAAQKKAERRRLLVVIGACVAVLAIIGAAVAWAVVGEQNKKNAALESISGDVAAASCDPVTNDPATGSSDHVGPGTNDATTKVEYATIPPSSGKHFATPALDKRRVYTTTDVPAVETLVHNLEHGYTILWYDPSVGEAQKATFDALAARVNALPESANKFLVVPWDTTRGAFPSGKKYALSHWSAKVDANTGQVSDQMGHRQLCGGLNVSVVEDFVKKHPWSSAPEPGAA